jgi:hypothetical protein
MISASELPPLVQTVSKGAKSSGMMDIYTRRIILSLSRNRVRLLIIACIIAVLWYAPRLLLGVLNPVVIYCETDCSASLDGVPIQFSEGKMRFRPYKTRYLLNVRQGGKFKSFEFFPLDLGGDTTYIMIKPDSTGFQMRFNELAKR